MNLRDHLLFRGLDPNLYSLSIDEKNRIVSFYLFNYIGQLVGYQQYRPDVLEKKINDPKMSRYFTYLPKFVDGIFGLENINYEDRNIFIVEGIFKAANLHRLGFNSIAVLTNSPKRLKPWFKILRQKWNLIAIGDNDKAGQQLVNIVKKGELSLCDLDEMKDKEILDLVHKYN